MDAIGSSIIVGTEFHTKLFVADNGSMFRHLAVHLLEGSVESDFRRNQHSGLTMLHFPRQPLLVSMNRNH